MVPLCFQLYLRPLLSVLFLRSIHLYQESHCGFGAPWATLVAFKDIATRKRWYRSSAEIEFNLSHRILPTKDGKSSLRYFDGATMMSYQIPEKTFEDVHCRQQTKPHDCLGGSIQGLSSAFNASSAYNPVFERHANHHQVPIQSMTVAGNDQNELKSTSNQASGASEGANANALNAPLKWSDGVAPGLDMTMDLYEIIYSEESPIQSVQILDTYFGKTLVTDGKTQSSAHDEFVYHESLVHPAMFWSAYLNGDQGPPKSVFIGGGGELATAREVLKHSSVERVVMVDIDGTVVEASKKYLPEWGGEAVLNHDKMEYIIGDVHEYLRKTKEQFDVIIIDVSDPIEAGPAITLYTQEFYMLVQRVLKKHGVFVTQAGSADFVPHPHSSLTADQGDETTCFSPIRNTLASVFDHAIPYSCPVASFGEDWGFVLAFNGDKDNARMLVDLPNDVVDRLVDELIEAVPGVPDHKQRSVGVKRVLPGSKGSNALKHYDSVVHRRMFSLSKPLREMMKMDARVMTIDNPIYMY